MTPSGNEPATFRLVVQCLKIYGYMLNLLRQIIRNNNENESRLQSSLLSSGILYSRLQRVTIPDAVIIQFVLLKMDMLMLEACRGL